MRALGSFIAPVSSYHNCVFIPHLVGIPASPNVLPNLIAAITDEGTVATDYLSIDASNNRPIIPHVNKHAFSQACVDALRILGGNFKQAGAGDLFALGVTRSIHQVLTVVGHTDEGAIMRDVFRQGAFAISHGGIHFGMHEYTGIPTLRTSSVSAACGLVDSVALKIAALVAHCDPGNALTALNSEWLSTQVDGTDAATPLSEPGQSIAGTDAHGDSNLASFKPLDEYIVHGRVLPCCFWYILY